ncbi:MAG TPA: HPr family phosphocarrier protein [Candidatus Dormibacteraeota bacterium]
MPASSEIEVALPEGVALHARPAGVFVRRAMRFAAHITVGAGDREADAKSILGVLGLGAAGGSILVLRAEGDDAGDALASLAECLRSLA